LVVGVKHQTTRVDTLHQHHTLAQCLVGLPSGQHAGRWIRKARRYGLILPRHKLRHGVLCQIRSAQAT